MDKLKASRGSLAPKMSMAPGMKVSNRVIINVGGVKFETFKSTLKNIPDTRLSWITESSAHNPDFDPDSGEYFFDRHPGMFNMILNYYRTGHLHAPMDVCGPLFEEELVFWGIDEKQIDPCCWTTYRTHRDAQETLASFDDDDEEDDDDENDDYIRERFGIIEEKESDTLWKRWQPRMWKYLEDPQSSMTAKVFAIVSVVFLILSIAAFCMETHVMFRSTKDPNGTLANDVLVRDLQKLTKPSVFLDVVEYISIAYFTVEIILRFVCCPSKKEYIKVVLNWLDLFSVLPFYLNELVVKIDPTLEDSEVLYFFNAFRLIRIFRILRLTKHVTGLKVLGQTMKASAKELLLLILVLGIGVLIFACLIYYAEQVEEHKLNFFRDIPRGFWWATVTMTTLGYGDMYPRTMLGYIVGAICALCGLLMLALPVPVIVNNFTLYYSHMQAKLKLPKKSKRTLVGAADALKQDDDEEEEGGGNDEGGSPQGGTGRKSSRKESRASANSENSADIRKGSDDSAIESYDSGIKSASAGGDMSGISVIFTDETDSPVHRPLETPESPIFIITSPDTRRYSTAIPNPPTKKHTDVRKNGLPPVEVQDEDKKTEEKKSTETKSGPSIGKKRSSIKSNGTKRPSLNRRGSLVGGTRRRSLLPANSVGVNG